LRSWPVPLNPNGNHPLFPKLPDGSRDKDTEWSYIQTWKEMEKLVATGKVKAVSIMFWARSEAARS
jgi:glycerol 2-dehydrogenase (NADP+)